jgi:hypothetical protein
MSPFNLANLRALLDSEPTKRMSMTLNYAELESLVITHDRAQRYEAALQFYADVNHYIDDICKEGTAAIDDDCGIVARKALG